MSLISNADRLPSRALSCLHPARSIARVSTTLVLLVFLVASVVSQSREQAPQNPTLLTSVPKNLLLQIVRAEDERRWDNDVRNLLSARSAIVRARAALAAGRIGNPAAVADLIPLLQTDDDPHVRVMAAFALGEIESPLAADALVAELRNNPNIAAHAQKLEALGKIVAALPREQGARAHELAGVVLETLALENRRRSAPDDLTVLLGLTAVLRSKPDNAGPIVAQFLRHPNARIRADAANTLARLKLKDGNDQLRKLLTTDPDPIVRANAARVLGATEDEASLDALLDRALNDKDIRVRVSAIRALGSLQVASATVPLLERGVTLLAATSPPKNRSSAGAHPTAVNELLEIATTLGRLRQGSNDERVVNWLKKLRPVIGTGAPELEVALARIQPAAYLAEFGSGTPAKQNAQAATVADWRAASSIAQGLGEIAALPASTNENQRLRTQAEDILQGMLKYRDLRIAFTPPIHSEYAIPDVLRAYAALKPKALGEVLREHLQESDAIVRATAAELSGELPPDETNTRALVRALPRALADKRLNDAALAILDALAKQKTDAANDAIKRALDADDYLIRRRAVALLQTNGVGDFSARIGSVRSRNTVKDYERALARIGKRFNAVVTTSRGVFTIRLTPDDAALTVDNFIQLATRGYFNGITFHRVVPNFVIQGGDPRGDGNGGPGYQIRCEINELAYTRGAVGMALSGKDTGGSQWFVTHSPQPHLDGGYTVFGSVMDGMETVDGIVPGDVIRSIRVAETPAGDVKRHR